MARRSSRRVEGGCAFGDAMDDPAEAGFDTGVSSAKASEAVAGDDLGGKPPTLISNFVDSLPEDLEMDRPNP